ncbi:MAG: hypothetical protein J6C87_00305 [Bacteroides sp.]|nr:hypothetical protein [Bacteroides sp.]
MRLKQETYKRGVINSSVFSIASKAFAFVMQMLVAYYYGATSGTDLFFYLYNIAILLGIIVQTLNSSILVPQAMKLRNGTSAEAEMEFHNTFFYLFALVTSALLLLIYIIGVTPIGTRWFINLTSEELQRHFATYVMFFPLTFLLTVSLYLSEILVSFKYFTLGLCCNFSLNLCAVVCLLLLASSYDVSLLMYSSCGACLLFLLGALWFLKKKLHWKFALYRPSYVPVYGKRIIGFTLNQLLVMIASAFPLYLLADVQPGLVTLVTYAQKIIQAPLAWIQQAASVLLVRLNNIPKEEYAVKSSAVVGRTAFSLVTLTLLTSSLTFVLRHFIAENLYGLGKIDATVIPQLSGLIGIMTLAMPFVAASFCYNKKYFAEQRIKRYVLIMSVANLLSCVAFACFIPTFHDSGYAYVYVATEVLIAFVVILCSKHTAS